MGGAAVSFLSTLVVQLPVGAALIVGLVLALVRRRRNPRAAALVATGIGLTLVALLLSTGLRSFGGFINLFDRNTQLSGDLLDLVFTIVNVVAALLVAVAWILVALAIIGRRRESRTGISAETGSR
jgi:hypothetical protein